MGAAQAPTGELHPVHSPVGIDWEQRISEMQAAVEDYFDTEASNDVVLLRLISITTRLIERGQAFEPLIEPYFWATYFRVWVAKGLEEQGAIDQDQRDLIAENLGIKKVASSGAHLNG